MNTQYDWPLLGALEIETTALIAIDMQVDFVGQDGWFDQLGIDLSPTLTAIAPLASLMKCCREANVEVIHTRESYRPGGLDIADNVKWRTGNSGLGYGQAGKSGRVLTRGEKGWEIIPELMPLAHEWIIDKPGKSAFWGTGLDSGLRALGIGNLIISGVTTDVCVQTTLRDAVDLGYECILATDACAASKTSNNDDYLQLLSTTTGAIAPMEKVAAIIDQIQASKS